MKTFQQFSRLDFVLGGPWFVMVPHPEMGHEVAFVIELLWEGDGVGVIGDYGLPKEWWLGDPDADGSVFAKIPGEACRSILSEAEVDQVLQMQEMAWA